MTAGHRSLEVPVEAAGMRLDVWLAGALDLPRTKVKALLDRGAVRIGGRPPRQGRPHRRRRPHRGDAGDRGPPAGPPARAAARRAPRRPAAGRGGQGGRHAEPSARAGRARDGGECARRPVPRVRRRLGGPARGRARAPARHPHLRGAPRGPGPRRVACRPGRVHRAPGGEGLPGGGHRARGRCGRHRPAAPAPRRSRRACARRRGTGGPDRVPRPLALRRCRAARGAHPDRRAPPESAPTWRPSAHRCSATSPTAAGRTRGSDASFSTRHASGSHTPCPEHRLEVRAPLPGALVDVLAALGLDGVD